MEFPDFEAWKMQTEERLRQEEQTSTLQKLLHEWRGLRDWIGESKQVNNEFERMGLKPPMVDTEIAMKEHVLNHNKTKDIFNGQELEIFKSEALPAIIV